MAENKCDNLVVEFQRVVTVEEGRVCIFALAVVVKDQCDNMVSEPVPSVAEAESELDNLALEPLLALLMVVVLCVCREVRSGTQTVAVQVEVIVWGLRERNG